jgi:error-prone DNA polymerase
MEDLGRRVGPPADAMEALATAGAFDSLAGDRRGDRRAALWSAGALAEAGPDRLAGVVTGVDAPALPGMSEVELTNADLWATGVSPDSHPMVHVRPDLDRLGVLTAAALSSVEDGTRVRVAGVVTHRQRPATASGTTFLNLEDETGLVNVICSVGLWSRNRRVARSSPALVVRGVVECAEGVVNFVADRIEPLPMTGPIRSRDFR